MRSKISKYQMAPKKHASDDHEGRANCKLQAIGSWEGGAQMNTLTMSRTIGRRVRVELLLAALVLLAAAVFFSLAVGLPPAYAAENASSSDDSTVLAGNGAVSPKDAKDKDAAANAATTNVAAVNNRGLSAGTSGNVAGAVGGSTARYAPFGRGRAVCALQGL